MNQNKVILKAENISKQYRLGTVGTGTLSHDLNRFWHTIRGKEDPYLKIGETNDRSSKGTSQYVWALQDINFEINAGEVVGIIGKNGAGKSTLLKILSKVTAPTTGVIKTKGRIASLLEVGTGFNPELTGRENIYLNGAILGMTKKEITSKLDEIIAFSGCERYIDTPTKRYSSGMTVRLAFAVAAFLEPEILVVDEVLAVGDAEFQKKAIGKMQDISKTEGRTVLFVSHNMAAVASLCTRGILMQNGSIHSQGDVETIINSYLSLGDEKPSYLEREALTSFDNEYFQNLNFGLVDKVGNKITNYVKNTDEVYVEFHFNLLKKEEDLNIGIAVFDKNEQLLFWSFNTDVNPKFLQHPELGENKYRIKLQQNLLNEDEYTVTLMTSIHFKKFINEPKVNSPEIALNIMGGLSESTYWVSRRRGVLAPVLEYTKI